VKKWSWWPHAPIKAQNMVAIMTWRVIDDAPQRSNSGSLATFAAIRRVSDLILIKVPIGQPCLKGRWPFSLTTDLTVMADQKLEYVISNERPIGFILSCAGGWKSYDQDGRPIGLFEDQTAAAKGSVRASECRPPC
jgi:hypothetical protein